MTLQEAKDKVAQYAGYESWAEFAKKYTNTGGPIIWPIPLASYTGRVFGDNTPSIEISKEPRIWNSEEGSKDLGSGNVIDSVGGLPREVHTDNTTVKYDGKKVVITYTEPPTGK